MPISSKSINPARILSLALAAATLAFNVSCSSGPTVQEYPSTAVATDEVAKLDQDIKVANADQVDQLSPQSYNEAVDKFNDAKLTMSKGKEDTKVLHEVAESRAYLAKAIQIAGSVRQSLPDVTAARTAAITAHASQFQKEELAKSDDELRSMTRDYEKGNAEVSTKDRSKLQNEYLLVELNSIKRERLEAARNDIEKAKKADAEKWAPRSLDAAQAKFRVAEKTIDTDRHDDAKIAPAVKDATDTAATLVRVTNVARQTRQDNPERMAMNVVGAQNNLQKSNSELSASAAALNATSAALSETQQQNMVMAKRKKLDGELEIARKKFSRKEAEVFRQGDKLLIRLKGLQFANNSSDLRGGSLALLAKVKNVVADLGAEHVVVEGHTDAVGSKEKNETLSEKRGEAVATYLVTEKVVKQDQVETKGYGFSRPIASNKSATGRAENRRVDVIITPSGAQATDDQPVQPSTVE